MQARHAEQHLNAGNRIIELYERARALDPDDARVAAGLAMVHIRRVFYSTDPPVALLERAHEMTLHALAAGPDLADSHLAAGHLELHTGDARIAAGHFRVAISLAPHAVDAHLWLGRLLLEGGFLAEGIARLQEAIALAPRLAVARWEIARAWALEGRWDEHDLLVDDLARTEKLQRERILGQVRFAAWRGDRAQLVAIRAWQRAGATGTILSPALLDAMTAVFVGEPWADHRDAVIAATQRETPDRRRRAFVRQLAAETAGFRR